jgi:hypothetical protein
LQKKTRRGLKKPEAVLKIRGNFRNFERIRCTGAVEITAETNRLNLKRHPEGRERHLTLRMITGNGIVMNLRDSN